VRFAEEKIEIKSNKNIGKIFFNGIFEVLLVISDDSTNDLRRTYGII
jgi:hypothetical protein